MRKIITRSPPRIIKKNFFDIKVVGSNPSGIDDFFTLKFLLLLLILAI